MRSRFFACKSEESVFSEVFINVAKQNPDFASTQHSSGHFLMDKILPLMARDLFHRMVIATHKFMLVPLLISGIVMANSW